MRDRVIAAVGDLYDVDDEIGRGGMAVVYRATDLRLRRRVAIKVLPPDFAFRGDVRARFLREAETAARLNHPNIVPIYSVDERAGLVFFVMAYIDGENVGQRLAREGRLPAEDVRRVMREVADALAYAHAHGVVHRDVKPDNILLERHSGRSMVTDFGIARAAEADSRLTVTGIAVGTPAYMSPEQAMGDQEIDGRSDLYSLGVVAYQMLAGRPPFVATNTPAMLMKHLSERPTPVRELRPDLPAALADAIDRALAKRPADRWPDAAALRDAVSAADLGRVSGGIPRTSGPVSAPARELWVRDPYASGEAARARQSGPRPVPDSFPPPYPAQRPGMSRQEWRDAQQQWRADWQEGWELRRRRDTMEGFAARPVDERIRILRRTLVASAATTGFLFVINMVTFPFFPWFLFPAIGMGSKVLRQWGTLWADGVGWREIFGGGAFTRTHAAGYPVAAGGAPAAPVPAGAPPALAPRAVELEASKLVAREVLAGPQGAAVRRAVEDRAAIAGILRTLSKEDRALIPDIAPTVDALVERAASLAQMLHRLDTDISPEMVARIEARIADVEREPETSADRERRLTLLRRQQTTLRDLAERRARVASQLESAGITLGNLKLDLVKLRSSGVEAALQDVTHATREARALSKEIGHVLDAAAELRTL